MAGTLVSVASPSVVSVALGVTTQLACLHGDIAARKKVALCVTGRDDITGTRKTGLALSNNKELELQLLATLT